MLNNLWILYEFFVDPATIVASPPNGAPKQAAGDRSAWDDNCPEVPDFFIGPSARADHAPDVVPNIRDVQHRQSPMLYVSYTKSRINPIWHLA
jgi:hypothetical protein